MSGSFSYEEKMNIFLENVDMKTRLMNTGPNQFAIKLDKYLKQKGHQTCTHSLELDPTQVNTAKDMYLRYPPTINLPWIPDVQVSFVEAIAILKELLDSNQPYVPLIQRLDGIYVDKTKDYMSQNNLILKTYKNADGIIFQSNYSKNLAFKNFGECKNYTIINNGADHELINSVKPFHTDKLHQYENVWSCASNWRGSKRLIDNIRYFLEFSGEKDCLLVAGQANADYGNIVAQKLIASCNRVIFLGQLDALALYSVYKRSKHFIHLSRYDACPNVVVDARAAGCHIICSSDSGTREVAGEDATVVVEDPWDFLPVDVDNPPTLDFKNIIQNDIVSDISMESVVDKYIRYLSYVKESATRPNNP